MGQNLAKVPVIFAINLANQALWGSITAKYLALDLFPALRQLRGQNTRARSAGTCGTWARLVSACLDWSYASLPRIQHRIAVIKGKRTVRWGTVQIYLQADFHKSFQVAAQEIGAARSRVSPEAFHALARDILATRLGDFLGAASPLSPR